MARGPEQPGATGPERPGAPTGAGQLGAPEPDDQEVVVMAGTITKRSKKKNKGLKRVQWIQSQIQAMKDAGRWYGSEKPNAGDRFRRTITAYRPPALHRLGGGGHDGSSRTCRS